MEKIQLAFFFINGFFISRLMIKADIPQRFVFYLLNKGQLSLTYIILILIVSSSILSFLIPNAITVLTMLPVIELLRKAYSENYSNFKGLSTLLALSVIYGANIGGMGSITATPANGILVGFAELQGIANSQQLNYSEWLMWAVPMVIIFIIIAWLVLIVSFRTFQFKERLQNIKNIFESKENPIFRMSILLTSLFFLSSVILSGLLNIFSEASIIIIILSSIIFLMFLIFLFLFSFKINNEKIKLLQLKDLYTNLPKKGLIFVGVIIIIGGILYFSGLINFFSKYIINFIPLDAHPLLFYFAIALITSFSTELLSNTVIQMAMFTLIVPVAIALGIPPLKALIIITFACTSAFMSPIATGVNGLAFGEVKGVSLKKMLSVGFIMNLLGAFFISLWIHIFL